ncbi:MAG: MFS transporter [Bacteroidetes bacterium]|nr:MFS transporter [Bacteroidota bacterium]MBU1717561.1 MFS transporter [Bacteroidota bacterium]
MNTGQKNSFPRTFWTANTIELFERWSWYGMFMVFALYLTGNTETGALGFSQEQKGYIMGPLVALLYFLPVITGAIADRYGYKRVLLVSFVIMASGYASLGFVSSFASVYFVFFCLAIGAALFKPVISATIALTTNKSNSSIGFGIFYMMVNLGAFIGPIFASKLRALGWDYVFFMSAGIIGLNFVLTLFFYREPVRERSTDPLGIALKKIFGNIITALADLRFLLFLIIIIGFWSMYNQLFYSLPVYIEQWMDTSILYNALDGLSPNMAAAIGTAQGTIEPEMLTNVDALFIVAFQVLVSAFVMRFKPLSTMTAGIIVSAIGIGLTFAFRNPFFLFFSILIFGLGEMATSPKITEYIGRIAPPGKTALYMGASFIPLAGGNFFAGILSGNVYSHFSDKISLLKIEVATKGFSIPDISETFTTSDYYSRACELFGMDHSALTNHLWNTYHPWRIWLIFTGIGLFTALSLFLYDRFLIRPGKKESIM